MANKFVGRFVSKNLLINELKALPMSYIQEEYLNSLVHELSEEGEVELIDVGSDAGVLDANSIGNMNM